MCLLCFKHCFCVFVYCPYIHPKFPSIISDGRGYLGTKWIYGQSGGFFLVLSQFAGWFYVVERTVVVPVSICSCLLFVVGRTWGMPLVNLYILLSLFYDLLTQEKKLLTN